MILQSVKQRFALAAGGLTFAALLFAVGPAAAGWPPPGVPSGAMPWDLPKYTKRAYQRHQPAPRKPAAITATPRMYGLHVNRVAVNRAVPRSTSTTPIVPGRTETVDVTEIPDSVLVIAHLPEDAEVWFGDYKTSIQGKMRMFGSPSLEPDKEYTYTVRVAWPEKGQWVAQMHSLKVRPGEAYCLDVSLPDEEEITASLAKLTPEDRAAAAEQRYCVVQEGVRLGSMGPPVKLVLKGKPVFLCCQGCVGMAEKNPDQTLEMVEKLKQAAKGSKPMP